MYQYLSVRSVIPPVALMALLVGLGSAVRTEPGRVTEPVHRPVTAAMTTVTEHATRGAERTPLPHGLRTAHPAVTSTHATPASASPTARPASAQAAPARTVHQPAAGSRPAAPARSVSGPTSWPALNAAIARIPGYSSRPAANWLVRSPYGHWGMADWYSNTIWVSPAVPANRLYDVAVHEYSHLLQMRAYGNNIDAGTAALDAYFGGSGLQGAETAADCMAILQGATWTHYTSCPSSTWRAGAARLLAGQPV